MSIDIWQDPWVPNCQNSQPAPLSVHIQSTYAHIQRVCQLINPDSSWNYQLISSLFHPDSVQQTISINIPHFCVDDKLIWTPCNNGQHSTKSAYLLSRNSCSAFGHSDFTKWAKLRRTKIHARHKLLHWKIIWNVLPTSSVLASRFHIKHTSCLLCFDVEESVDHLFLHCPFAVIVWSHLTWPVNVSQIPDLTVVTWIKMLLGIDRSLAIPKEYQNDVLQQAVITLDYLWQLRNQNREEMKLLDPIKAAEEIKRRSVQYRKAWENHITNQVTRYKPQVLGSNVQFNTDVTLKSRETWVGIACTNTYGSLIAAWSYKSAATAPAPGEMEGIIKALEIASAMGIHLLIASDAKDLVDAPQSSYLDPSPLLADLISQAMSILTSFTSWNVIYSPRSSNFLAHNIAKWASSSKYEGLIDVSSLPSCVLWRDLEG